MTGSIRAVLVDDHPFILGGLRELLSAQQNIEIVGEATSGASAFKVIRETGPDIAVLDISLPDLNGLVVARRLREEHSSLLLIVLSLHEERAYLKKALEVGVRGFVLKRSASEYLLHAIHTVLNGGVYIDPKLAEVELRQGAVRARKDWLEGLPELTEREAQVLKYVALGHTQKEIAGRLEIGTKSVETYKMRGLEKLGLKTRSDVVRYAAANGWLSTSEITSPPNSPLPRS